MKFQDQDPATLMVQQRFEMHRLIATITGLLAVIEPLKCIMMIKRESSMRFTPKVPSST